MKLRFACPLCDGPVTGSPDTSGWTCPACGRAGDWSANSLWDGRLSHCAACGCEHLYRQKDFPQWFGLSLLTIACAMFFVYAIRYQYAIAWAILLGSAAFDAILYLIVGDVAICYRCGAQHRGTPANHLDPFELAIAERYRQERLRREQLKS